MDVFRLNMRKVLQNTLKKQGRAFQEHIGEQRRVRSQRNAGKLGAFLSGNLLAGSAVSEGICWRKLSCGGHLPG